MGLFDSVYAPCAHCGAPIEYQSKADEDPCMSRYNLEDAPSNILHDVLNDPHYCAKCGNWTALYDRKYPPERPEIPRPMPVPRKLRQPRSDEIHIHTSQPYLRWWNAPLTSADFAEEASPAAQDGA